MSAVVLPLKGKAAPKSARSSMETMIINIDQVNTWRIPPFQRPIRINPKVEALAEELKANGCAISGVLTLGRVTGDSSYYVVDGQHRLEAFRLSGMGEIIADIRIVHFDTMAEMAEEFVQLNTALVRMRPDDLLRGLAPGMPALSRIMRECPYVGYTNVRRGDTRGAVVSLGAALRCWWASSLETPTNSGHGMTINGIAASVDDESAGKCIRFLHLAHAAWGHDPEYYRLWGSLNLALCMWLYRRMVLQTERRKTARVSVLTDAQFKQALMALSASTNYVDWLQGRLLNDRDRSPALVRIKQIFARRLSDEGATKIILPQPAWASR